MHVCIAYIGEQSGFGGIKEVVVPKKKIVSTSHSYREKFAVIFSGSLAFPINYIRVAFKLRNISMITILNYNHLSAHI